MGSSVYFIFFFIDPFPLSPISRADDPDDASPVGKANRDDPFADPANAIEPVFITAVASILYDHARRVEKSMLGQRKGDAVLGLILFVFFPVPVKCRLFHERTLSEVHYESNTIIWLPIFTKWWVSETCGLRGVLYQYLIVNCRDATPSLPGWFCYPGITTSSSS